MVTDARKLKYMSVCVRVYRRGDDVLVMNIIRVYNSIIILIIDGHRDYTSYRLYLTIRV